VELRDGLTPAVVIGGWLPLLVVIGSLAGLVAAGLSARAKKARPAGEPSTSA
jgi:apolipoprotein N-acyltransferase